MGQPITLERLKYFNCQLAAVEAQPKPVVANSAERCSAVVDNKTETRTLASWYEQAALMRIQRLFQSSTESPEWEAQWLKLDRQMVSMGIASAPRLTLEARIQQFTALMERYKQNPKIYPGGGGALNARDQARIRTACMDYPQFAEALLLRAERGMRRDQWAEGFVKFCLRSGMNVSVFVETPNETDALMGCHLDKRVGAVNPDLVRFIEIAGRRSLAMQFDGRMRPIQGSHKNDDVVLGNSPLRIKDIFAQFKLKTTSYQSVEVVHQRGVILWNTIETGVPNPATGEITPVDVTQPNWILQMPPIGVVEDHELQALYPGQRVCQAGGYGLAIRASREKANLDVLNNHAYIELLVPNPHQAGQFFRYPMGFQSKALPATMCDRLCFLGNTLEAGVHTIDESAFLTNRQQTGVFLTLSPQEYQRALDHLGDKIQRGRAGNLYFQPTGENCGYFVQELYDAVRGREFYEPLRTLLEGTVGWTHDKVAQAIDKITQGLDTEALKEVAQALSSRLSETADVQGMQNLVNICIRALDHFRPVGAAPLTAPNVQEVYDNHSPEEARRILQESLESLVRVTVDSQQFYKIALTDAELDKPGLSWIYSLLHAIPWNGLRLIVLKIFLFLFGSWRGYTYVDREGASRTARTCTAPVAPNGMMHLPARLFAWGTEQTERRALAARHLETLAAHPIPLDVSA